jgi:hypothetical protein
VSYEKSKTTTDPGATRDAADRAETVAAVNWDSELMTTVSATDRSERVIFNFDVDVVFAFIGGGKTFRWRRDKDIIHFSTDV